MTKATSLKIKEANTRIRNEEKTGKLLCGGLAFLLHQDDKKLVRLVLKDRGYEWMLVVSVETDEEDAGYVSFHSGEDMGSVIRSFALRVQQDAVRWRVDKPFVKG